LACSVSPWLVGFVVLGSMVRQNIMAGSEAKLLTSRCWDRDRQERPGPQHPLLFLLVLPPGHIVCLNPWT
jgi:hypothetical protein